MGFFYCSDKRDLRKVSSEIITKIFGEHTVISDDTSDYFVYSDQSARRSFFSTSGYLLYIQGYVRDIRLGLSSSLTEHCNSFVSYLSKGEEHVQSTFAGLFSAFVKVKKTHNIILI